MEQRNIEGDTRIISEELDFEKNQYNHLVSKATRQQQILHETEEDILSCLKKQRALKKILDMKLTSK